MAQAIHFYGNKEHGYSAHRGMYRAKVKKVGNRWASSHTGDAYLYNSEDGRGAMSTCGPTIVVGTDFRTRRDAAEAALTAARNEDKLWREACDKARVRSGGLPPPLALCRQIFAGLVSDN